MKAKKLHVVITLFLPVMFIISCGKNECDSSCTPVFPDIIFKIVNSSGQNLTCGPNKMYTSDKIDIRTSISGTLTSIDKLYTGDSTQATSGLIFLPAGLSSQYYLYINNVKTDSFQLAYQLLEGKTECCPQYQSITSIKLNNVAVTIPFNVVK